MPPTPDRPLRVALYTRVSTDIQAGKEEGSLDTQEARLRAYLTARGERCEVCQVFREEGASGKSLDRPALQRLLQQIERDEIDLVLVTRLDRLSRSLLDFYELHRRFEKHNVRFVSLNETFDTSSPVGRAMLKLVLVFAELEREQTADRTRSAMQARAERGLWNGGPPPLGYTSLKNGHLSIDVHEAEMVRLIFGKYLEMRSAPALAKWLNTQGHRQKRYVSRRRGETGGKPFTPASVRQMLTARLYLGEISHKGEVYAGQHEPIIEVDVFDRVQAILDGNAVNRRGPPLRAQHDYPLTGIAQCACGYALTSSAGTGRNGQTYFYYRCVGLQKKTGHDCEVRQIRAETLETAAFAVIREAARDPKLLEEAVAEANRLAAEHVAPLRKLAEALSRELTEVEEEGRRTLAGILKSGVLESDFARSLLSELETRRNALRQSLAEAQGALSEREGEQLDAEALAEALRGFDAVYEHLTSAEKRELLQLMVHQVSVHPDRIDVDLYDGRRAQMYLLAREDGRRKDAREKKLGRPRDSALSPSSELDPAGIESNEGDEARVSGAPEEEDTGSRDVKDGFVGGVKWLPVPLRVTTNSP